MSLVKNVLNPSKKGKIVGSTFHLIFLGIEAVLYDELLDEPIIYGNKFIVKATITNPTKLKALLPLPNHKITLFIYAIQNDGEIKRKGTPVTGLADQLTIPNY